MTLRSPPGGIDRNAVSPKLPNPRDLRDAGIDMPVRSPKLLRSNSSKKVAAASNLERALLSFKTYEADAACGGVHAPDARAGVPSSPVRRIHGARPGRLALHSPNTKQTMTMAAAANVVAPLAAPNPRPSELEMEMTSSSCSPRPRSELLLDEAATKVQKVFKGHRTRRSLADCAIVIEELWWKLYDSALLDRKSISFFTGEKQETAASRWVRAAKRIAKVGKGLCKDDKAQQLALRHWLEAIDPRHRYGHNLHLYYDIWFQSSSTEPFFYWLDIGAGREVHHPNCPRSKLNSQLIMYLEMNERAAYEVIVEDGRLTYMQSGALVNTTDDSKWIFVLSTSRSLYVGQKKKGRFQHSSFLAGGATSAAGRLVAKEGVLKAIWPYSGHYLPTEENFNEFISFLRENNVDLTNVKRCSVDDDEYPSFKKQTSDEPWPEEAAHEKATEAAAQGDAPDAMAQETEAPEVDTVSRASLKWTSGAGARIGCVRDYPAQLQSRALEQVNLSPRVAASTSRVPIPSPRPSPRIRLSPRVQYMGVGVGVASPSVRPLKQQCLGIRTPTVHLTLPTNNSKGN
ncbi:IQ domain-containing protein IQM1-like [Phragmites australis]|uniref:IQ domain-containing protein IQM1-like n=1 Tax=Phragmites australis TaxID=29695 RepID=UPI002D78FC9C|nr:IQ domain-containing protein IQM1-like [Phragmites australis]